MKYIGHIILCMFLCTIAMGIVILALIYRFVIYPLWELKWWKKEDAGEKSVVRDSVHVIHNVYSYIKVNGIWKFMTEGYLK